MAELADAHDSGSCVRNGRGGSTPLQGIKHGLLTVLFYCANRFLWTVGPFGGTLFLLRFRQFACLVCHFLRLDFVELFEMGIVHLGVVIVLHFHAVIDPVGDNMCGHS